MRSVENVRIGIDIQVVADGNRTGLYNHLKNLVQSMARIGRHDIALFAVDNRIPGKTFPSRQVLSELFGFPNVIVLKPRMRIQKLWHFFSACNRVDVLLHNLHGALPMTTRGANVFLVPDVIPLGFDYGISGFKDIYMGFYRKSIDHGDGIVVSSEHTKFDLMKRVGGDSRKVFVAPLAAGDEYAPRGMSQVSSDLKRYGLNDQKYILFVATIEKRKNHAVLLRAFRRLLDLDPSLPHKLVFVGGKWIGHEEAFELVRKLGLEDRIVWLGYADSLPSIYAAAEAFVFPSLYEGFGLPPLEAMACGVPTLVANTSSLPEVIGDAGILFEPEDDSYLAEQLFRVVKDPYFQSNLRERSLKRAKLFSWDRTAEMYLDAFEVARRISEAK